MAVGQSITNSSGEDVYIRPQPVRLFDEHRPLHLVCGDTLAPVDVLFETYGTPSPSRDNAILVNHALTGNAHAASAGHANERDRGWWDGLIGPGKALDTDKYFVICSNLLGSCYGTTGPMSVSPATGEPYLLNFPPITTIDMARVQKTLLDYLEIGTLVAVLGGSLGGMVTWQYAVSYAEAIRSAIPIAGTPEASPWVIALNEVARQAIYLHPDWQRVPGNDRVTDSQWGGLKLARMIAMISYRSELSFCRRFKRDRLDSHRSSVFNPDNHFKIEGYLHNQGKKLVERFDPFTYITLTRAMDWHDISFNHRTKQEALNKIQAKILGIGIDTDRLFPAYEMKQAIDELQHLGKHAAYEEIASIHGHDAFLIEYDQLNRIIGGFLKIYNY